jgi:hypothetical protein
VWRYGQAQGSWLQGGMCRMWKQNSKTSLDFKELDIGGIMEEVYGSYSFCYSNFSLHVVVDV